MIRSSAHVVSLFSAFAVGMPMAFGGGKPNTETSLSSVISDVYMNIYGHADTPNGFARFCEDSDHANVCNPRDEDKSRPVLTRERKQQLEEVNLLVNLTVQPATDSEIYGQSEKWAYPVDKGDCEDYALLKQKILLKRGWPLSSMLMTVVIDDKGEGHAVLTARTAQGDFVLDNKVDDVKVWNLTGYEFISRQSYLDPRVWVSLMPVTPTGGEVGAGSGAVSVEMFKPSNLKDNGILQGFSESAQGLLQRR